MVWGKNKARKTEDNITLTMEVDYHLHPSLIGKRGQDVKALQNTYGTLIHFCDSNKQQRNKSNQVTISGNITNVENTRKELRVRSNQLLNEFG